MAQGATAKDIADEVMHENRRADRKAGTGRRGGNCIFCELSRDGFYFLGLIARVEFFESAALPFRKSD
jgi:hypothetical protein